MDWKILLPKAPLSQHDQVKLQHKSQCPCSEFFWQFGGPHCCFKCFKRFKGQKQNNLNSTIYLRGGWTKAWLAREKEKGLIQALDVRRFKERVCEKLFQWPSSSHLCSKHLLQRVATFSLTCSTIAVLMRQPNAIVPGGDMPFIRFTSVHFGSTHSFLANKRWWWWWRWWWWRWWWGWWWRRIRSGSARARREGHQI